MRDQEIRNLSGAVELRESTTGGPGVLVGYAAVFNRMSQNLGGFVEQVDPNAFDKSLADRAHVVARYNHKDDFLLGTTTSGTLVLRKDGTGLQYEVDLPDTQVGRDLAVLAKRGDVSKSSFAFMTMEDDWGMTPEDFPLRTLRSVKLIDVAPVVSPAYLDTTAGLRSLAHVLKVDVEQVKEAAAKNELRTLFTDRQDEVTNEGARSVQGETHTPARIPGVRNQHGW